MAEITMRRTGEFLRTLFDLLLQRPDGMKAGDALAALAERMTLTPYESGVYESSGTRRFDKIVRFATVDCVKAGWMSKNKGVWTVTELGKTALRAYPDPDAFYREAVRLYRAWKRTQSAETPEVGQDSADGADAAEKATVTYEQADEQAWSEIQAYLAAMPP
ncbi:MAG TPA: winged helix-turn-helix domain-containing protein [Beijerinckiaceae bacterium]